MMECKLIESALLPGLLAILYPVQKSEEVPNQESFVLSERLWIDNVNFAERNGKLQPRNHLGMAIPYADETFVDVADVAEWLENLDCGQMPKILAQRFIYLARPCVEDNLKKQYDIAENGVTVRARAIRS